MYVEIPACRYIYMYIFKRGEGMLKYSAAHRIHFACSLGLSGIGNFVIAAPIESTNCRCGTTPTLRSIVKLSKFVPFFPRISFLQRQFYSSLTHGKNISFFYAKKKCKKINNRSNIYLNDS